MSASRAPARAFLGAVVLLAALAALPVSTLAAAPSVASSRMLVLFNIDKGQLPENMAPAPGGALDVVLNGAGEVAQVGPGGRVKILATLPAPADGGVNTPLVKSAFTAGMVRAPDGTIYTLYSTGTSGQTGIYRIVPGGTPQLIVALPATSLANGLALDTSTHELYVSDSALGVVWRAPQAGGTPEMWASGAALAPTSFLGANGLKLHDHAIWVSNTDAGTILRIPIESGGGAGPISVFASGSRRSTTSTSSERERDRRGAGPRQPGRPRGAGREPVAPAGRKRRSGGPDLDRCARQQAVRGERRLLHRPEPQHPGRTAAAVGT